MSKRGGYSIIDDNKSDQKEKPSNKPWLLPIIIGVSLGAVVVALLIAVIVLAVDNKELKEYKKTHENMDLEEEEVLEEEVFEEEVLEEEEQIPEEEEVEKQIFKYHANFDHVTVVDGVERITYDDLSQFTYQNILIIPESVKTIDRDALLSMLNLEAIIIDTRSPAKPENCDYPYLVNRTEDSYSDEFKLTNVTIFRTPFGSPSKIILPSNEFAEGYEIPFIQYAGIEEEYVEIYSVDDPHTPVEKIKSATGGFELHKVRLDVGEYQFKCGMYKENLKVVPWNKGETGSEIDENGVLNIPYGVNSIEDENCIGYEGLKKLIIPSSLKVLDTYCFADTGLEEVYMSNGVKILSAGVFSETNVTEVDIPESVSIFIYDPFAFMRSLKTIKVNNELFRVTDNNELIDTRKMSLVHYICPDTQDGVYTVSPEIRNIEMYSISSCPNIKKIVFHEEIDNIETYSIGDCQGLTSVIFPDGMKRIDGYNVFMYDVNLKSLTIPPSLWTVDGSISRHAFMGSFITTICLDNTGTDKDCSNMKEKVMLWFDGSDEEVDREVKCGGCQEE